MLNEETKNEIRNLIDSYGIKKWDQNFLDKISEIVNNDDYFDNCISIIKDNHIKCPMETDYRNTIYENSNLIEKFIVCTCKSLKKNLNLKYNDKNHHLQNKSDFITQNFLLIFLYLHECSHVKQSLYAYKDKSEYDQINSIYYRFRVLEYRSIFDDQYFSKIKRIIRQRNYHNHHDDYFYERNADIESLKELMAIYDNNFFKDAIDINYIKKLISYLSLAYYKGYEKKGNKIISPFEKTLKYCFFPPENFNFQNLPFEVIFEHGFPITFNEYQEIFKSTKIFKKDYKLFENFNNIVSDYHNINKKIKSLNRK